MEDVPEKIQTPWTWTRSSKDLAHWRGARAPLEVGQAVFQMPHTQLRGASETGQTYYTKELRTERCGGSGPLANAHLGWRGHRPLPRHGVFGDEPQLVEKVRSKELLVVWLAFMRSWARFLGYPQVLLLDQGTEFLGEFRDRANQFGILIHWNHHDGSSSTTSKRPAQKAWRLVQSDDEKGSMEQPAGQF